ncbi:hypothetical protein MPSEU_000531400 [Mayamaea pseudoterrestris]|nr:hypothetical protein MPSEU_000531400 [Mayamaea pseudoterrestris]
MLNRFIRRVSTSGSDAVAPPQGYGSIPTTESFEIVTDCDDDDESEEDPFTKNIEDDCHDEDSSSNWLDLETPTNQNHHQNLSFETPSPYAAAGYQRVNPNASRNLLNASVDVDEMTPLATKADATERTSDNGMNYRSTPTAKLLANFQDLAHDFGETTAHLLHGETDEENNNNDNQTASFHGQATIASEIATMTKSIVGCGVLSLPSGIAMYAKYTSNTTAVLAMAIAWIMFMGAVFSFFCLLLGKLCSMTQKTTYRACWQATMGHEAAVYVSLANATKAGLADLAYSTILSQTVWSLLQTMGFHSVSRIQSLWLVTLVGLLPLCLLRNINVLAPFSVLGTLGILLTALAMAIRLVDGSYQPGGKYFDDLPSQLRSTSLDADDDTISQSPLTLLLHMLPFVCMLFESFVMHYNSPRFYAELQQASVPRFAIVVAGAFGLSTFIFIVIACTGFLTFGTGSDGYILNNYSHRDPLATACRLAIALAILLTYPLAFIGMRDGVMQSFYSRSGAAPMNVNALTLILLGGITLTACVVTDLGLINAVGGGTLAMAIVFVFPTLMYQAAVRRKQDDASVHERREAHLALVLMIFGVAVGLTGSWLALVHAM